MGHEHAMITGLVKMLGLPVPIDADNAHVFTALLVATILIIAAFISWLAFRKTDQRVVPAGRMTVASTFELVVETILGVLEGMVGADARRFLPLIGTVFIYIFVSNLVGVVPWVSPPTSNINTNLAVAACVFVYYNYVGVRRHGLFRYVKHMAGPVAWLAPLMLAIEIISHIVRPISLSVRLMGNMVGDHMVLSIFSDLIPVVVPIVFMGLAIFVAFIQAFVFTLLSVVYISLAVQSE